MTANTSIYVIGSAFKELDGSLVAGAKTWQQTGTDAVICPGTSFGMPRKVVGNACTLPADAGLHYGSPLCGGAVQELQCLP